MFTLLRLRTQIVVLRGRKQGLGCEMDEKRCRTLISVYDLDRSGVLETEEFVTWMMLEHVKVRGGSMARECVRTRALFFHANTRRRVWFWFSVDRFHPRRKFRTSSDVSSLLGGGRVDVLSCYDRSKCDESLSLSTGCQPAAQRFQAGSTNRFSMPR